MRQPIVESKAQDNSTSTRTFYSRSAHLQIFSAASTNNGRRTKIFTFQVGQSCRSALNSWAAQQRRPTGDMKILVLHPPTTTL
jgi:hypothetical protein